MIRLATQEDIPRLVKMGQRFRNESTYGKYLAENPEKMAELGKRLIEVDGLILAERGEMIIGMLGFILHRHFISGELVAGEVFWWVEPEFRGEGLALMMDAERRAKLAGAQYMHMIAPNESVEAIYKIRGYERVESTWQRNL